MGAELVALIRVHTFSRGIAMKSFIKHQYPSIQSVPRGPLAALPTLALLAMAAGCASDPSIDDEVASNSEAIVDNATLVPIASRTSLELAVVRVNGGCTGTLLRPDWVLTAKHCVLQPSGLPRTTQSVVHDKGLSSTASATYVHPEPTVDAALLKLATPINAGQLSTISLYAGVDTDLVGKSVVVYGYGGVSDLSRGTRTVQSIENDGSMQSWQRYNRKYLRITDTDLGDSGGPSFRSNQVVALTGGELYKAAASSFRNWANALLSPATNNRLGSKSNFYNNVAPNGTKALSGDVNGDGYTDIVQFNLTSAPAGSVYVIPGTSSGFGTMVRWHSSFASGTEVPQVGDVNGDGMDDIVKFDQSTGKTYVSLSTKTAFASTVSQWHSGFSYAGETPRVGDVNGDGRDDVITFVHYQNWGDVWVSLSCGTNASLYPSGCTGSSRFGNRILWHPQFSLLNEIPEVGDVNGDGLADLVTFNRTSATVSVALTTKQACSSNADCGGEGGGTCWTGLGYCAGSMGQPAGAKLTWATGASQSGETPTIADMNGDGYLDVANFETTTARGRNGYFGVMLSNGQNAFGGYSVWGTSVCSAGNVCFTGDIGRDGRADVLSFVVGGADYFARSLAN